MPGERGAACLDGVVVMMEGSRKAGGRGAEGPEELAGLDASRTQEGAEEQAARSCPWIKRVSQPSKSVGPRSWIAFAMTLIGFHTPHSVLSPPSEHTSLSSR